MIPRKKASDMHDMMEDAFKFMNMAVSVVKIWIKIQRNNAKLLQVSQEQVQELCQQRWMMFLNLYDWFDAWETFCLHHGVADKRMVGLHAGHDKPPQPLRK